MLRRTLGQRRLIVPFAAAWLVSQVAILTIVRPLGSGLLQLQCCALSASEYLRVFHAWQESGAMAAYRAHFVFDDVHWLWYSGLFTSLLCRLFESRNVSARLDWMLVLPLLSGLLDGLENLLQHVFLSTPDFSKVVDPLPLLSAVASDLKWLLALVYVSLTLILVFHRRRGSGQRAADDGAR